jgi:LuxR family maltose regulon positive regulatory protein
MLVSAPAGFGKTTLLTEWLASRAGRSSDGPCTAWLSLDQEDNQPGAFWIYVIAALRTVAPDVGTNALALLQEPEPPSTQAVLTTLINDLGALTHEVVLVLDDYHVIESGDVRDGLAFLLDHLPHQLHLVIASRADPALPLARLRARGELVEIRAAELRFRPDEALRYLTEVMGLVLSAQDVSALEGRTEGWIAALQLAALSMQDREDTADFIASFAGDDRYIVDYLVEEVLQRQPEQVQSFLLQTSILSRLRGSLCDAVTGQQSGKEMLDELERENLFLVPLDDRRQWYRYHHLFADVLQARLVDERPDDVPELHRRASAWYEQNGERFEAIQHAIAGDDFETAADLVELALPVTLRHRQELTLLRWLTSLPDELIQRRPVLSNAYAGTLLSRGELEGVESRLRDAERGLRAMSGVPDESDGRLPVYVVVDHEAFAALPAGIAVHRAGQARLLGDAPGTRAHARTALDLVGDDNHIGRGAASALLGLACWTDGDLDEAYRLYADGMASLEKAGHYADVVAGCVTLADIRIAQGRLVEAMAIYEEGLRVAHEKGPLILRGAADMHVGISELLRERNDLEGATRHLSTSEELGEGAGFPQNPYRWRVAKAGMRRAEGDLAGAIALLEDAERVYAGDYSPNVRPVAASRTRVLVVQGRWGEALDWARERGLTVDDDPSYLREYEHITLARALLAQHRSERAEPVLAQAVQLLQRLLPAAEQGGRGGSVIEVSMLLALAYEAQGDTPAALVSLERALTLAEPEGYCRLFVEEGPPMAGLLESAADRESAPEYARRLLGALGQREFSEPPAQPLIEALSERELDVLRLLGTDLGGPDIARELVVSLHTVRSHTKKIYAKLGVNNRRAAVRRAEELDLLQRPSR